jgi:hypothetical protein
MIQQIDINENAGNSLATINSNVSELESLVCNLQQKNIAWHDALDVWNDHYTSWNNMTNTVNELSGKWTDFANVVHSLSSFWNGTITFIYPTPFVEGTQNVKPIYDFLTLNQPANTFNTDQKISVFYFIQNFEANPSQKENIFQKSVSSVCFQNVENDWKQVDCWRNNYCLVDNCSDLFEAIDVNSQYSCMAKTEILYYLVNS